MGGNIKKKNLKKIKLCALAVPALASFVFAAPIDQLDSVNAVMESIEDKVNPIAIHIIIICIAAVILGVLKFWITRAKKID